MYFDLEDYHPDIAPIGRAISWREGILLSIILHLLMVVFILLAPRLFPYDASAARARQAALEAQLEKQKAPRFVFVQPRVDTKAPKPPDRAELSDADRAARAPERAKTPTNPMPYSRGNSRERTEQSEQQLARGQGPAPDPSVGERAQQTDPAPVPPTRLPEAQTALQLPSNRAPTSGVGRTQAPGGSLGDALRNLQRYVQRDQFENPGGTGGAFGPAIQFDTKGVEFGPWIRYFIAQVKRNWLIPYAAMTMQGHVVVTFNVHKDGSISDLAVVGPSPVGAFNNAAYGALATSNPTKPLPPEYPSDKAFFTVTFFYNEEPPQ